MAPSRSVDRLAYTYYTGQDGSEAHGPNCHKCMNDLFHEGKLYDVQTVFLNTPGGVIPVAPRFLVFTYGVAAPFSLPTFAEDLFATRCAQCAEKAIRMQMSEAAKQGDNDVIIVNRLDIKAECVPEAIPVMSAVMATEPIAHMLTHTDSPAEFSSGQLDNHIELQSNTASQNKSYESRRSPPRTRSPCPTRPSISCEKRGSLTCVRRSGSRSNERKRRSLDMEAFHKSTSPPRRGYCRSSYSSERSVSEDGEIKESREYRRDSVDHRKDGEHDEKKRKCSRSCSQNKKKVMYMEMATEPIAHTLTHTDSPTEFSSGQLDNHIELHSNTASQNKSYERRRSPPRSRIQCPSLPSRSRQIKGSLACVRRSGSRSNERKRRSLDMEFFHKSIARSLDLAFCHKSTAPPRRILCRSPYSSERSVSEDGEINESREYRRDSVDHRKDGERDGKKRKFSRSCSQNRKKDRRSRSRERKRKSIEDFNDNDIDLPFLYGRPTGEVNDPILEAVDAPYDWLLRMVKKDVETSSVRIYMGKLARLYFVNQEVLICGHCDMMFSSFDGTILVYHLVGKEHWENVKAAGLVFSHSKDLKKLLESSLETYTDVQVKSARIPFVSASRIMGSGMRLETLADYLNYLMRMKLINEELSEYLFHVYPNLKDIGSCSLCELPISPGPRADGYLKHFLSSTHMSKARENNWNLGSDFGRFVSHLYTFLKQTGGGENQFLAELQLAKK